MHLDGWWARLALVGLVASAVGCRDEGSAAADTETDTDGSTGADAASDTDSDTDTETESDGEPEPETTELTVNIVFANEMMQTVTNSVHVWVVQPKSNDVQTCADLVADEIDPYDLVFVRLADHVSTAPADPVVIAEVEVGDGFVYVEGVTVGGTAELAGCAPVTLEQPSTSIDVTLGLAGTFDCSDPETENGAPCDDGMFCTVGEACSAGACTGGAVRDCSVLADQCNAASCTESDGCVLEPVPNDTTCSDDLACTESDSCQDGVCVGLLRDCDAEAPLCQQAVGCAEPTGECIFIDGDEGLACDDELFCTENTTCQSGQCLGDAIVCPGDDCNVPSCDEIGDACITTPADDTTSCDDTANECTDDTGTCDGLGVCVAAAANEGGVCDNDGVPGTCTGGVCG